MARKQGSSSKNTIPESFKATGVQPLLKAVAAPITEVKGIAIVINRQ